MDDVEQECFLQQDEGRRNGDVKKRCTKKDATRISLERTGLGGAAMICLGFWCLTVDSSKQLTNYGVLYLNNKKFPVPQTLIVALGELLKLFAILTYMVCSRAEFVNIQPSLRFLVPAVLYTINNNVYFYGLTFVSPPLWMVLIQSRVVLTAFSYKCLGKVVTRHQWLGCCLITAAVVVIEGSHMGQGQVSLPIAGLVLSLLSSAISVAAAVYTEVLFKNDKRPFVEQQLQLYGFSLIVAVILNLIQERTADHTIHPHKPHVLLLVVIALLLSSLGGIVVAVVIRRMDNIAKYYISALGNVVTGVCSALLFPSEFSINIYYVASLALLFAGIYFYEKKTASSSTEIKK